MAHTLRPVSEWERFLHEREAAPATIEKYRRAVAAFVSGAGGEGAVVDKAAVIAYKSRIMAEHAPATVNAELAAVNGYLDFCGAADLKVRRLRIQAGEFRSSEREITRAEYLRLARAAQQRGRERDALLVQTIGATGIRVSEVGAITVEAAQKRVATVVNKGKVRRIWIPQKLCRSLLRHASRKKIKSGPIFLSRTGRPIDRTCVWRVLKGLARLAGVDEGKVFPHNLRHLFAVAFYEKNRDINSLSGVLGHSRIETTRIYLATNILQRRSQIERLGLVV